VADYTARCGTWGRVRWDDEESSSTCVTWWRWKGRRD